MLAESALYPLLAWSSPGYPIGGFSYSHGLEGAVADGLVSGPGSVSDYVTALLAGGGLWADAVLFAHSWRAAGDAQRLDALADLAAAFRATSETALESRQQGRSFLAVSRAAWPHPALDAFARSRDGLPVAQVTVAALASAAHGLPLGASLRCWLYAAAANLVSAAVRLGVLGQTGGQVVLAGLAGAVERAAAGALATPLDDLGSSAPVAEHCSLVHETLYTRLFRS